MAIVAIDFEASCLPRHGRSFPIEVGIADGCTVRSWLIRPDARWSGWDWTQEAQALHGIARDELWARGRPAPAVMAELMAAVGGRRLVADSDLDQVWLDTLAHAAGWTRSARIDHAGLLLDEWQVSAEQVERAQAHADRVQPQRHRAGADARWLAILMRDLAARAGHAGAVQFDDMVTGLWGGWPDSTFIDAGAAHGLDRHGLDRVVAAQ